MSTSSRCPGCHLELDEVEGPCDPYRGASPACWAVYGEVLSREYSNPTVFGVHQCTVNAYMVQHPSRLSRAAVQSVWIHLVGLCLTLERNAPPAHIARSMAALAAPKREFEWLEPPADPGAINAATLRSTGTFGAHARVAREWAECVWAAWSEHQPRIRALADTV